MIVGVLVRRPLWAIAGAVQSRRFFQCFAQLVERLLCIEAGEETRERPQLLSLQRHHAFTLNRTVEQKRDVAQDR